MHAVPVIVCSAAWRLDTSRVKPQINGFVHSSCQLHRHLHQENLIQNATLEISILNGHQRLVLDQWRTLVFCDKHSLRFSSWTTCNCVSWLVQRQTDDANMLANYTLQPHHKTLTNWFLTYLWNDKNKTYSALVVDYLSFLTVFLVTKATLRVLLISSQLIIAVHYPSAIRVIVYLWSRAATG